MILPDLNLLLYATFDAFPEHARARTWWEATLNGSVPVGLVAPVLFGFVRLSTSRRVFTTPMTVAQASSHVHEWLSRPQVRFVPDSARHVQIALDLLERVGAAGNLTTDAQIAAHAVVMRATVYTHDTDFGRFDDVTSVDPITE